VSTGSRNRKPKRAMRPIQHAITDFELLQFIPRAERLLAGWDLVFYLAHSPDRYGFYDLVTDFAINRDFKRLERKWQQLLSDRYQWTAKVTAEVKRDPTYVAALNAATAAALEVERGGQAFREGRGSAGALVPAQRAYEAADFERQLVAAQSHQRRLRELVGTVADLDDLSF